MKIQRKWLLITTASIGVIMILYTLVRQFFGFNLGEAFEKFFFDGVFIAAIGLLMLNRKIVADEKKEKAEKESLEAASKEPDGADESSGSVHDGADPKRR